MAVHIPGDGPPDPEAYRNMISPSHVDQMIRGAVQMCWTMLPSDRKNVDSVQKEIQRLVDRVMRDMREDQQAFFGSE